MLFTLIHTFIYLQQLVDGKNHIQTLSLLHRKLLGYVCLVYASK